VMMRCIRESPFVVSSLSRTGAREGSAPVSFAEHASYANIEARIGHLLAEIDVAQQPLIRVGLLDVLDEGDLLALKQRRGQL
jgi:hypothetical protein